MEKVKVKICKENDGIKTPKYMSEGAAGMDVCANIEDPIEIKSLERKLIPTGIKLEIPYGYEIQVRPRSGLAIKHGITLVNSPGTIDSDYRGEIKIILINMSTEPYTINPKERIGQLVLQKVYKVIFEEENQLSETIRGSGGFGHTGS
jgi:dUTP pyrophosphatase